MFKVKREFQNSNKIHPMAQNDVYCILDFLKDYDVDRVIIFGSSISRRCTPRSDIDIYIDSKDKDIRVKLIKYGPKVSIALDIWTNEMVDDRLLKEITDTGVVVYG